MSGKHRVYLDEMRKRGEKVVPEDYLKGVLKAYGMPVPACRLCASADEAVAFAAEAGFPVVLKLASGKVLHKTELKGVRLGLENAEAVRSAFTEMDSGFKEAAIEGYLGILVEHQAPAGTELIVGL